MREFREEAKRRREIRLKHSVPVLRRQVRALVDLCSSKALTKALHEASGDAAAGVSLVLEHRKLSALLNCHVTPLLSFCRLGANCDQIGRSAAGRVHPVQVTMESATGRVGTRSPNMQCLPHAVTLAAPYCMSGELNEGNGIIGLRECVVASEGWTLLSADYSQLELRIIAHLSQVT